MKWWEIPQNCSCLFALDSESIVEEEGTIIHFTNQIQNHLTPQNSVKNKVFKSIDFGFKSKDFKNLTEEIFIYNTLKIDNINLILSTPVDTTNQCTWFLKVITRSQSVFSQGSGTNTHGLVIDNGGTDNYYGKNWYANAISSATDIPVKDRLLTDRSVHTVSISNDSVNQKVIFNTDYNVSSTPNNMSNYFNSEFGSRHDVHMIGYADTTWSPKADIIAYGLFDGILTEAELSQMADKAEEQFLIKTTSTGFKTYRPIDKKTIFTGIGNKLLSDRVDIKNVKEPETKPLIFNNKGIPSDLNVIQKLYINYKNINDIVLEEGVPAYNVQLFLLERNSYTLLKSTVSDTEGKFSFFNLNANLEYIITANDSKYQFSSIIKNYNQGL